MPLQHLADNAAKGPNMGSGAVNLACFSQCPIDDQKDSLWDPEMQASNNDFIVIKKCIQNNNLGLVFNVDHKKEDEQSKSANEERKRTAMIIKEQRLRQKLLSGKAEQDLRQLTLDHQESIYKYQKQCDELQQVLKHEKEQRILLEEKTKGQQEKIAGMREYFESKLKKYEQKEAAWSEQQEQYSESNLQVEMDRVSKQYAAELEARDVELIHRRDKETQLQREIVKLKTEKQDLAESSRDILFHQLDDAGINFVTYHPGAGHLTIEADEIDAFLSNNMAYVATKCGVSESHYRAWLNHYYSPTCESQLEDGSFCDKSLVRLENPSQFIVGESSCCSEHRYVKTRVVPIRKCS
jgi:hypothetical protein